MRTDLSGFWVILDELPTLHQVPSLQPGLAESRQFGGCFVLGVQVASALRDLYGRNGAETISGLCGTRMVLAAPDRDTAQWSADSLGRSEVEEVSEGFSYGANTIRDGVSLTPRRELRALALPSEIMRLANLEGYLKFSESEWEEAKRAAQANGLPTAEFVRQTILALARAPEGAGPVPLAPSMTPLIERMFRYIWFLATERRDAMVREGRGNEVDALVAEARALDDSLRRGGAD